MISDDQVLVIYVDSGKYVIFLSFSNNMVQ